MHNSAHALGKYVDDVLSSDSTSADKLSDDDLKAITDLSLYIEAAYKAATVQNVSYLLTSTPSGYGFASLVDTNKNPSNMKTIGTMIGGAVLSSALSGIAGAFVDTPSNKKLFKAFSQDAKAALNHLETRSLINRDTKISLLKKLEDAENAHTKLKNICKSILAIESLACGYHGFKRNGDSFGYALAWALCNGVGLGVALQQGYGKPISN